MPARPSPASPRARSTATRHGGFTGSGAISSAPTRTTRLLDNSYILTKGAGTAAPIEVGQWHAVLRSASGYHAFRRIHSSDLTPARVAAFLLFNPAFPLGPFVPARGAKRADRAQIALCARRQRCRGGVDRCTIPGARSIEESSPAGARVYRLHPALSDRHNDRLSAAFLVISLRRTERAPMENSRRSDIPRNCKSRTDNGISAEHSRRGAYATSHRPPHHGLSLQAAGGVWRASDDAAPPRQL